MSGVAWPLHLAFVFVSRAFVAVTVQKADKQLESFDWDANKGLVTVTSISSGVNDDDKVLTCSPLPPPSLVSVFKVRLFGSDCQTQNSGDWAKKRRRKVTALRHFLFL